MARTTRLISIGCFGTPLILFGLAIVVLYFRGAPEPPTKDTPRPPANAAQPAAPQAPVMEDAAEAPQNPAPPDVIAAKDELRAEYAKQKQKIPEEVAMPLDQDIGVIEGAAADLLAAIAHEPDDENLKMMLIQTYRNEMKLLKKALHLSSAEDDAEPTEETPTPPAK